jgi:hypothetical protein
MNGKAVALIAPIFLVLVSAEILAAGGSRHFGHFRSGHLAGSFRQSGGFHTSFGHHGLHLNFGSGHVHLHPFGHLQYFHHKMFLGPHHHFDRHLFFHRPGVHSGFFFGHRVLNVRPSSGVFWSYPAGISDYIVSPPARSIDGDTVLERPLITIMLRHGDELSLSPQQVQILEKLRDGYQREATRYEADIRIAEMDLQRLLKTRPVELEQVKAKLQEIEDLKTEIRFARIRAIEHGKALLSIEQYEKLQALLSESRYSRLEGEWFSRPTEE